MSSGFNYEDLRAKGYVENEDGSWARPGTNHPVARLEAVKHGKQRGALDGRAQTQQGRKKGGRRGYKGRSAPEVTVTMVSHVKCFLDGDNAINALKPVRDALADWLAVDDGDGRIRWQYGQVETRGREGVCVVVETTKCATDDER